MCDITSLRDELARNGTASVRIEGNSMWPLYPDGRVVTVSSARIEDVRVGDVVVVQLPDHVVYHRVFRKAGGWIQTKADDSHALDPRVGPGDLIAKVEGVRFGYLISRLSLITSRVYPLTGAAGKLAARKWGLPDLPETAEVNRAILSMLRAEIQGTQSQVSLREIGLCPRVSSRNPFFLERVFAEGVSGLLYRGLSESASLDVLPGDVRDELQKDFMRTMGRNMLLREKLVDILGALQRAGVKAILLRGRNLWGAMYPSSGVKAGADIDILISGHELECTRGVFAGLGYCSREPYPYLFWKDDVPVDVHLDSACFWKNGSYRFPIDLRRGDVWENGEVVSEEFPNIRFLSVCDSVLLCCVHAEEHGFDRMITMLDAAALVTSCRDGFDWDGFVERAKALGLDRPAYFTMRFLREKGLLDVPDEVISGLAGKRLGWFERKCLALLLDDSRPAVHGGLLYLLSIKGTGQRLRFLKGALFPAHETGSGSRWLRPFKLAAGAARGVFPC